MVPAVLEKGADEPAVLLHYCQGQEISRKNLGIFRNWSFHRRLPMNIRG